MGKVTLNFNENDFRVFYHYCSRYCRLNDETRKNSIQILLELYKHQVIDIQEHNLDNVFTFFYNKNQEFETECRISASSAILMMRVRICSDIISFLGDLEKIYYILRKKGMEVNYLLLLGTFSKIINQMWLDDLNKTASGAIDALVGPIHESIEKKIGPEADIQVILNEFVSFVGTFNRLSPNLTFNDRITTLIATSLIKRFGKEANYEQIHFLLKDLYYQFEVNELESALDGSIHAQHGWDPEFHGELLLEPLRTLHEIIGQRLQVSRDVLSALEEPLKTNIVPPEYTNLTLYQDPCRMMKRRNDENLFLVNVDTREHNEIQLSPSKDLISPSILQGAKKYYPATSGIMILIIIILASFVISTPSQSALIGENMVGTLIGTKNITSPQHGTIIANFPAKLPDSSLIPSMKTGTPIPIPQPTPQYVTIAPVIREPDTSPKSHQEEINNIRSVPNLLIDPKDYVTIFKNDIPYNGVNSYTISFNLKNPPMLVRYSVSPRIVSDIKWFEPRDSQKKIDTINVIRPDEFAWFEMKFYKDNILDDKQGWGGLYGNPETMQEIVIRNSGKYEIEFSGHNVKVNSEVLVKKEGNIEAL